MATPNMGLTLPVRGPAGSGLWDDTIDDDLEILDGHDHSPGKGPRVPASGLNIDGPLSMAGNKLFNIGSLVFAQSPASPGTDQLWRKTADNELYYTDTNNNDVKITLNGGLNLSATGGILGDYAAAGAALWYDNAAEAYRFLEATPGANDWSYIKAGGFDLYEHDSGITSFIGLRSPAGLGASYNVTFPAAVPASTATVQVSTTGQLSFATAPTFTGLTTHQGGATMAANQHVTVSGTGRFKHGTLIRAISAFGCISSGASFDAVNAYMLSTGASVIVFNVPYVEGETISEVSYQYYGNGAANITSVILMERDSAGVPFNRAAGAHAAPAAAWATGTLSGGGMMPLTPPAGSSVFLVFNINAAGIRIGDVHVSYSRA